MRRWLLATLAAVTMAVGLVAAQPAPQEAQAAGNYCTAPPQRPVLGNLIWGIVYWDCYDVATGAHKTPAGQLVNVQLQRLWTSDGQWHNQGAATSFTTPASSETYADTTACHAQSTTRAWRTHTWGLVWFKSGGPVSSWNYYSSRISLYCWS